MTEERPLIEAKKILGDLIAFPTISEDSNLDIIAYLAEKLRDVGAEVQIFRDETGKKANLFATLGPSGDGGIILSGHTDVVPVEGQAWSSDPFTMMERDGCLFGRGSCDMKGFIAATIALAPSFAALPLKRPLHFAFTYDEEVGCFGAQALLDSLDQQNLRPSLAIIGEPTEMQIVEGHKGCYEYTTEFKGLEGHSSMPDQGVSAVEYAVRFATKLLALRDEMKSTAPKDSRFEPRYTTMHIGRIEGGTARNVIAQHCHLDWEIRPVHPEDSEFVKNAMSAFVDNTLRPAMKEVDELADIVTRVICEVDGLQPVAHSEAREMVAELTGANSTHVVAFGTEAGLFQTAGLSAIICGPGSIAQAHKADEFLSIGQLNACLIMLEKLKAKLIS
ncbi:MAG: acetylornithine deacetylase [Geminicoccales bacterium]